MVYIRLVKRKQENLKKKTNETKKRNLSVENNTVENLI